MDPRERFRSMIESEEIIVCPGVYDGISAKVVESLGFETALVSGAGMSNSRLGVPDYGIMDLTENAAHSSRIVDAVDIPIHADGDTGYGNAINVYHTVRKLEKAGVVSIMIEDQKWPKRCGHMEGKSVIPKEDMVKKVEAAVEAREDPNLIIKARTDATAPFGREEAVERLNSYADAGAELLFADALLDEDDIEYVCKNTVAPCSVNMGYGIRKRPTTPLLSPKEAQELGADLISYPRLITGSAVKGMMNALSTLKESVESGEVIERPDQTIGFEEYTDIIGLPAIEDLEDRFA